jgi:ABC-2 type transport system ATP-binding protein
MEVIKTEDLTKYYGRSRGIYNINLEVEEGDIFGFIGPNGAGKSTTIRTLLNYIYPTRGSARIFGLDIVADSRPIRAQTGYVPAEVNYYGDMSVKQLLHYSASFYPKTLPRYIDQLAQRFELDMDKKISELSFGNKKKVAIVQALLHQPRLLILDEPTSGLDPLMQNVFYEVLKEANQHTTIFLSSHVLGEVQRLCHKIAFIKQGEIIKVENIETMRDTQFKTITAEFNSTVQIPDLKGIVQTQQTGNSYQMLYNGDINQLIQALARTDIKNLLIEEPSLEEIFMHYYEGDSRL